MGKDDMLDFNTAAGDSGPCARRVRASGIGLTTWFAVALLSIGCLAVACKYLPGYTDKDQLAESLPYLPDDAKRPVAIEPVTFGEWHGGWLNCSEKRCYNLYRIEVARRGRLRVDIYAPFGANLPDFDVTLLNAVGQPVAKPARPDARPRRILKTVDPDSYVLRVDALGSGDARLEYELVAELTPLKAKPTPRPAAVRKPKPPSPVQPKPTETKPMDERQDAPPPAGQQPIVSAEVLDTEIVEDAPAFVLLDAGMPQGVEVGLKGELRDEGTIIGEIEVVEVYTDGSRARILGELRGDITFETLADIFEAR